MMGTTENSKGNDRNRTPKKKGRSTAVLIVLVLVFALIAAGVFIVTKNLSEEGERTLAFPRITLDPEAVAQDMSRLRERAEGFEPNPEEAELVRIIGDLHRYEAEGEPRSPDAGTGLDAQGLVQRFREIARTDDKEGSRTLRPAR